MNTNMSKPDPITRVVALSEVIVYVFCWPYPRLSPWLYPPGSINVSREQLGPPRKVLASHEVTWVGLASHLHDLRGEAAMFPAASQYQNRVKI